MGKLIVFWSPYTVHAKVTSSLCAIAGAFGMEHPELNIAITHIKPDSMELEGKLDEGTERKARQELYKKSGMAALKVNYRQAILTSDKIMGSAIPLKMKSLFLYPYVEHKSEADDLTYCLLTQTLKREFDMVFLDLWNGDRNTVWKLFNAADFIVTVLPQEPWYWEHFFEQEEKKLIGKKYCILIGGYLDKSKYSSFYYSKKKEVKERGKLAGVIPMNTGFFDAMSDGKTLDYFFRNQYARKKEENYEFIVQTKKAAECIRKKVYLP